MSLAQDFVDLVMGEEFAAARLIGDHSQIAANLNTKDQRGLVPIRELSSACLLAGLTGRLDFMYLSLAHKAALGTATEQEQAIGVGCAEALSLIRDDYRLETADIDSVRFQTALATFVLLGWLTEEQKDDIVALGANRRSRAELALGRDCTHDDVAAVIRQSEENS